MKQNEKRALNELAERSVLQNRFDMMISLDQIV